MTLTESLSPLLDTPVAGIVAGVVVVRIYYWAEHRRWMRRYEHLLRVQIANTSAPTAVELNTGIDGSWRP